MGDLRPWSPEPKGAVLEERPTSSSSSVFSISTNQRDVSTEYWRRAEEAMQGVIAQIQRTHVSERRRKAAIDYVQRIIGACIGCVPVWISTSEDVSAGWSAVVEREDHNMAAEFMVKDVQLIRAKVCRFYVPYNI
ncbi:hypothetical protein RchiOBHm_Chr5g0042801 [Rosa chinensis]|uniref:Uncharacterized protein n=1 Tax=Rosa chinensis TaxID=74649 RepID=A0A2P6QD55_ROSCH|nr:hypothetical protein RchiOBHm_Chr5g0042801 [Rosa chinensis]